MGEMRGAESNGRIVTGRLVSLYHQQLWSDYTGTDYYVCCTAVRDTVIALRSSNIWLRHRQVTVVCLKKLRTGSIQCMPATIGSWNFCLSTAIWRIKLHKTWILSVNLHIFVHTYVRTYILHRYIYIHPEEFKKMSNTLMPSTFFSLICVAYVWQMVHTRLHVVTTGI